MKNLEVLDLHQEDYFKVYQKQLQFVEDRKSGKLDHDVLILVEHPEVYTFGRKNKLPIPPEVKGLSYEIERGGEGTYHNPGQLVAYPIWKLEPPEQDLHKYLRNLETMIIKTLKEFSISGERVEKATGVWVAGKKKKIASIGVAVRSWITYHGIALNVSNDLSGFTRINPCGFDAAVMTSMEAELEGALVSMLDVKDALVRAFSTLSP